MDQTFVRTILGGRDAVGLPMRQKESGGAGPWHEILGVVRDLATKPVKTAEDAVLYRPAAPGAVGATEMVVRARGDAASLPATVGRVAAAADPTLRLYDIMPLSEMRKADGMAFAFFLRVLANVSAVARLLSTAGVYSLMSFTLSRRTREIGIRVALGAAPRRIITTLFSRAFAQIGLGILAGCAGLTAGGARRWDRADCRRRHRDRGVHRRRDRAGLPAAGAPGPKADAASRGQEARCMPQRRRLRKRPLREIPSSLAAFS